MDARAMGPFGAALKAYSEGNTGVEIIVHREDGVESHLPVAHFFRSPAAFSSIEREALQRCQGTILDVGAGTGVHSLELQRRGMSVMAVDISPDAVEIMSKRGVKDTGCSDIFTLAGRHFDTMLLMGHGIGMMETLAGLDRFLVHARTLLSDHGQILLDSMDPAVTVDARNLAYHAAKRRVGKYIGEVGLRFEYQGTYGPYCGWLHLDPDTLRLHAETAGWSISIILQEASGDYLAQLTRESDH